MIPGRVIKVKTVIARLLGMSYREYVKLRKISGSTRSDEGRRCRDTFASLKKTALKMGIGFWDYLIDRTTKQYSIPSLDQLVLAAQK